LTPLFDPFFFLQVPADAVEVVGEHAKADVFFVVCFASVGAAVESVMLKGVDITLNRAVFVGLLAPVFLTLTLAVGLARFPFFGNDDLGNFEFQ